MQRILPILAHPDRERVTVSSEPTLDEYVQKTRNERDTAPDSDPEERSPG
jgi:hypothetical protein